MLDCTPYKLELIKEAASLLSVVEEHGIEGLDLDEDIEDIPEIKRLEIPPGFTFGGWRKEVKTLRDPKRYKARQRVPQNFKFEGCSSWLKAD